MSVDAINKLVEDKAAAQAGANDGGAGAENDGGAGAGNDGGAGVQELLKKHGLSSVEELEEMLQKKTEETPEQKQRKEELRKVNITKYAVDNNLMRADDFVKLETMRTANNEDLVFKDFAEQVKDEILEQLPDDATEEDILAAIRKEFEAEYPLNGGNDKARARAEAKLNKRADELRQPLESSYKSVSEKFDQESEVRQVYPAFKTKLDSIVESVLSKTYTAIKEKDGDDEIDVSIKISDEDRAKILESVRKRVETPESFMLFKGGKTEEIGKIAADLAELEVLRQFAPAGHKKVAETYFKRGLEKGSIGAENPFGKQGGEGDGSKDKLTAQQEVLKSTRKQT